MQEGCRQDFYKGGPLLWIEGLGERGAALGFRKDSPFFWGYGAVL